MEGSLEQTSKAGVLESCKRTTFHHLQSSIQWVTHLFNIPWKIATLMLHLQPALLPFEVDLWILQEFVPNVLISFGEKLYFQTSHRVKSGIALLLFCKPCRHSTFIIFMNPELLGSFTFHPVQRSWKHLELMADTREWEWDSCLWPCRPHAVACKPWVQ